MRALVVGYGSIARRHIENLRELGTIQEYVVLRPGGRPQDAPAHLGFVTTLAEAVASNPDIAVVASPSSVHVEVLRPLLKAGVPCYVEKPPVTTEADVAELRAFAAARKSLPVTLTGCNLRFLPSLRRMRELLRSGAIGRPVRATLQAGQWLPDWRPGRDYRATYSANASASGGVIFDLIHEIDAARWLFGEFEEVRAFSGKFSQLEIDADDTACVLLGAQTGPIVMIGLDYVSRTRVRRYEIVGDRGSFVWDLAAKRLECVTTSGTEILSNSSDDFDIGATYMTAMREFVNAVKGSGSTSQDLIDGLATTSLALRARTASGPGLTTIAGH